MRCRFCGELTEHVVIDLGEAPPSNAYVPPERLHEPDPRHPLRVLVCDGCWLVQTEHAVRPEVLFHGDYAYHSSFSSSWLEHTRRLVSRMTRDLGLDGESRVVEIGANDGYLLRFVCELGVPCYGIEPARGPADAARQSGIEIVERFFSAEVARDLAREGKRADWIPINNVFAHVPDIGDFASGIRELLMLTGVATIEFPSLGTLIDEGQFDTIYHEHYSYLSLTSAQGILSASGLQIIDVEHLPTHGGSLRLFVQRSDGGNRPVGPNVDRHLDLENGRGMTNVGFYQGFQARAERIASAVRDYLSQRRENGIRVAGYGAAAKGNTLLNYAGVGVDLLPYVVDLNPAKQGQYLPGSRIPIVPEDRLRADRPERILILPWNLQDEITKQLSYVAEWGGRFVRAIPELEEWGVEE